ncbi:hypothetical protein B7463_g1913, partial [Scytalidium lignicola]
MVNAIDLEKQSPLPHTQPVDDASTEQDAAAIAGDPDDAQVIAIRERNGILRFLARVEKRIHRSTEFEAMGVERVPENQRRPPQKLNVNAPLIPPPPSTDVWVCKMHSRYTTSRRRHACGKVRCLTID